MKKFFLGFLGLLLFAILGLGIFLYVQFRGIQAETTLQDDGLNRPSVLQYGQEGAVVKPLAAIPRYDFQVADFGQPAQKYGPYVRWWWPGNDVDSSQLKKEIKHFAEVGIAGVEIQPFTTGLNPHMPAERQQRVDSWATPAFYANLAAVMNEALQTGLTVDLNSTGGWPTGGTQIALQDNFKTLLYSEKSIKGGQTIREEIAYPKAPFTSYLPGLISKLTPVDLIKGSKLYLKYAKLETVVAYKVLDNQRSPNFFNLTSQVMLDPASAVVLDKNRTGRQLSWKVPEGNWQIVGFWSLPADEQPLFTPGVGKKYVVDHFDSARVKANYNYLFGKRTGLTKYYGKPFRALFNDSYEFTLERHFAPDFFSFFQQQRGYDIRPYLAVNMIPAYNHAYGHAMALKTKPAFVFGPEDWRLVHDYDLTISELLEKHFFVSSKNWLNQRGILHRTQAYGLAMDNIKAASLVDIPESEHLYGEFSYAFLKLVSSGSFLYNRPLTTSESIVFQNREYMTSPLKAKVALDKAFCNGVNQAIYHGSAYPYFNEDFSRQYGWFPWSSPFSPMVGFSFDYRSTNPLWKPMTTVNQYVRRTQYALQAGKPKKDVLVYFPFLGIGYQHGVADKSEILKSGYFEGYEPAPAKETGGLPFLSDVTTPSPNITWLQKIYPTLNTIEAAGLDWSWVDNQSILEARVEKGMINIRGNYVAKIILPSVPYLPLEVVKKLDELATQGAKIEFVGELPTKQPGYKDYQRLDAQLTQVLKASVAQHRISLLPTIGSQDLQLHSVGSFPTPTVGVALAKRVMSDSSLLAFYTNKTARPIRFVINSSPRFLTKRLLNPFTGQVFALDSATVTLQAYESALVYFSKKAGVPAPILPTAVAAQTINLSNWTIRVGGDILSNAKLFNWTTNDKAKYAARGEYETQFTIGESYKAVKINLAGFAHIATISVNGKPAGTLLVPPYQLDLTPFVQKGTNRLKIIVDVPLYNHFVGEALKGDKQFVQFKGKEGNLMNTGMQGPVSLLIY